MFTCYELVGNVRVCVNLLDANTIGDFNGDT